MNDNLRNRIQAEIDAVRGHIEVANDPATPPAQANDRNVHDPSSLYSCHHKYASFFKSAEIIIYYVIGLPKAGT